MSAGCPRCQKPLETAQVDEMQVRLCQKCRGMLLAHPDLVQVLEASWRAVSEKKADELSFHAPDGWTKETILHCPDCRQSMDKYGYMGLAAILIDRCDRCLQIWLDTDELQNMVLALAKSNYRSQRAMRDASKRQLDFVSAAMPGLAASRPREDWLFDGDASEGMALAFTLLRLFAK